MTSLEESIIHQLKISQKRLCTVESCTGGLIAHRLTNVPGASEVFWGSFIVYDNSAKLHLNIDPQLLLLHGAVSHPVAEAMAEQGLKKMQLAMGLKQFLCLSTTGIAGPGGGSQKHPVGICFIGIAISGQKTFHHKIEFDPKLNYQRLQWKNHFAEESLKLIHRLL